jgi:hypothetical protein
MKALQVSTNLNVKRIVSKPVILIMIFITQLIYIKKGEEAAFHQFEKIAIPLIRNYRGGLLLRVRPSAGEVIEGNLEPPYEIHLIEFES